MISTPGFLVPFHLGLNKEIHHHLLPHISLARIPSAALGTVWLPWQLHPAVKEGRRKRAQAALHRNSAEKGPRSQPLLSVLKTTDLEFLPPNIYYNPCEESFTLNGTNMCIKSPTTGEMHQKFSLITLRVHAHEHAHAHGATGRP